MSACKVCTEKPAGHCPKCDTMYCSRKCFAIDWHAGHAKTCRIGYGKSTEVESAGEVKISYSDVGPTLKSSPGPESGGAEKSKKESAVEAGPVPPSVPSEKPADPVEEKPVPKEEDDTKQKTEKRQALLKKGFFKLIDALEEKRKPAKLRKKCTEMLNAFDAMNSSPTDENQDKVMSAVKKWSKATGNFPSGPQSRTELDEFDEFVSSHLAARYFAEYLATVVPDIVDEFAIAIRRMHPEETEEDVLRRIRSSADNELHRKMERKNREFYESKYGRLSPEGKKIMKLVERKLGEAFSANPITLQPFDSNEDVQAKFGVNHGQLRKKGIPIPEVSKNPATSVQPPRKKGIPIPEVPKDPTRYVAVNESTGETVRGATFATDLPLGKWERFRSGFQDMLGNAWNDLLPLILVAISTAIVAIAFQWFLMPSAADASVRAQTSVGEMRINANLVAPHVNQMTTAFNATSDQVVTFQRNTAIQRQDTFNAIVTFDDNRPQNMGVIMENRNSVQMMVDCLQQFLTYTRSLSDPSPMISNMTQECEIILPVIQSFEGSNRNPTELETKSIRHAIQAIRASVHMLQPVLDYRIIGTIAERYRTLSHTFISEINDLQNDTIVAELPLLIERISTTIREPGHFFPMHRMVTKFYSWASGFPTPGEDFYGDGFRWQSVIALLKNFSHCSGYALSAVLSDSMLQFIFYSFVSYSSAQIWKSERGRSAIDWINRKIFGSTVPATRESSVTMGRGSIFLLGLTICFATFRSSTAPFELLYKPIEYMSPLVDAAGGVYKILTTGGVGILSLTTLVDAIRKLANPTPETPDVSTIAALPVISSVLPFVVKGIAYLYNGACQIKEHVTMRRITWVIRVVTIVICSYAMLQLLILVLVNLYSIWDPTISQTEYDFMAVASQQIPLFFDTCTNNMTTFTKIASDPRTTLNDMVYAFDQIAGSLFKANLANTLGTLIELYRRSNRLLDLDVNHRAILDSLKTANRFLGILPNATFTTASTT